MIKSKESQKRIRKYSSSFQNLKECNIRNFLGYKKGEELVSEQIIFFFLNILFFSILLLFVIKTSSSSAVLEETYSKTIALSIDSMRAGTTLSLDITRLYDKAENNKYIKSKVLVDSVGKTITVKLSENSGYSFKYFSSLDPQIFFDDKNKLLIIKV